MGYSGMLAQTILSPFLCVLFFVFGACYLVFVFVCSSFSVLLICVVSVLLVVLFFGSCVFYT